MAQRIVAGLTELKTLVGQEVGISDWFVITQSLIDAFADTTFDKQWIHCDPRRAETESPFGTTIAHGFLTLSLLSHLHGQAVRVQGDFKMGVNYGFNRVRFPAPVKVGSRIRVRSALESLEEIGDAVQLIWAITVEIEDGAKPALVAEWLVRLYGS